MQSVRISLPTAGSGRAPGMRSRRLITLIQIASLFATAWMVWWAALVPRLQHQTALSLLFQVLGYTVLAWTWSVVVAFGLYSVIPLDDRSDILPNVFRTAATAVWFGPAMLLLSQFSLASLAPALVLVIYTSRLLYAQWRPTESPVWQPRAYVAHVPGSFDGCQLPRGFVWRERVPALAVAFCVEAGAIAVAGHFPLLGAAWFCLGAAVLTVFSMATGAADAGRPPTLPKSLVGILATVILASLLAMGGGGPGRSTGWGLGSGSRSPRHPSLIETARLVLREFFYGEEPPGHGGTGPAFRSAPDPVETGAFGGFPGVILWPEIKPVVTLVAPLPELGSNPFAGRKSQPLSIPFGGEYWLYRFPFDHPPSNSYRKRGNPSKLSFSTTDQTALQMQAHQTLDVPLDTNCCRAIQVEIVNADRFPGTLSLELELIDGRPMMPKQLSLGIQPVRSQPDPATPMREILEFAVPDTPPFEQFTTLQVIFHRARSRADKSARISIERFMLLPR
jgi:hypothetical protein